MIYLKSYIIASVSCCLLACSDAAGQSEKEEWYCGYRGGFNKKIQVEEKALNFMVVGDWGRNGEYYQQKVARQMGRTAASLGTDFIVSVGDNFYPDGVQSVRDPNWDYSFEQIYSAYFLHCNWYVALGNHDYKGNIEAQIEYSTLSRRWQMPSAYYSRKFKIANGAELLLVVMDTNPFIDSYYGKDEEIGRNVARQDTAAQRRWLEQTLNDTSSSVKWKVVVGHHPMYSGGKRVKSVDTEAMKRKFQSLFDRTKVVAYICGHEHDLQVIRPEGRFTTQFLSGAGCEVRPSGATEGTHFFAAQPGFMTFTVNAEIIRVQVVQASGKILYTSTIKQ